MSCAHAYVPAEGGEGIFSIDASNLTFGRGALREVGPIAVSLGAKRVALFTDPNVAKLEAVTRAHASLKSAGLDVAIFDEVAIEPTDRSFLAAARFAREGRFDGYVSVGGGSTIDTCKAAILYATHPADFLAYVNKPVGAGLPAPSALPPHVACPTTSGTGSELTGIAVCDLVGKGFKTGIASRRLRPTFAVVDPDVTRTLPSAVVAASGFDVLCHALESFTARPFVARNKPASPIERPMSQGRNPWSDLGSLEALRLCGRFLERAVHDASDDEAREQMMWAATLAGLAFGNAGVHLPHAMAYAVAGAAEQLVPHGISVVTSAPAAFRFTASSSPELHRQAAAVLGAEEDVVGSLERLMRATGVPLSVGAIGFGAGHVPELVAGTIVQRRLLDNAPVAIGEPELTRVFLDAVGARA